MRLWGATSSHVGNVREINQDRVYFRGSVAALADGMGGHQGGERAAELAIGEFRIVRAQLSQAELVDVVEEANRQVHHQAADPDLRGMGTTMVALGLHKDDTITVANVGDSRAYWLRGNYLAQITEDHSFVEDLVRQGRLSPEEATVHPQRNILTRALGIAEEVLVDRFDIEPKIGDRFLLCSDGLFNEVSIDDITELLLNNEDPKPAADALMAAALETPCRDNVTVAVVNVVADDHPAVVDQTDMGIVLTPPEKITDQLPIVARSVVTITDRPDRGGNDSGNGDGGHSGAGGADTLVAAADTNGAVDADLADVMVDERPPSLADDEPQPGMIEQPVRAPGRGKVIWAVLGSLLAVAMIAGVYFGAQRYNDSLYHVTTDEDGELVIHQGRQGGLLWLDPVETEQTGVFFDELTDASQSTFDGWGNFTSLKDAQFAVDNLVVQPQDQESVDVDADAEADADPAGDDGGTATTQDG